MEKILIINSVLGVGSTGKIVLDIAKQYEKDGFDVKIAYGRKNASTGKEEYGIRIGNYIDVYYHAVYSRLTDKHGLASKRVTRRFLKWAEEYNPDVLWLHNIHGYYINYEELFEWIKSRPQMEVKWTLHDCWAFTGHCSYYTYVKCDKWKSGCGSCPQLDKYPKSFIDNSKRNYIRKKKAFTGVSDLTIITPSNWLKMQVENSFLSEYPLEVVYNRIDTRIFKPTLSNFKEDYGIQNKKIILGVANIWEQRKGLDDIIKLSQMLDAEKYSVVLVGLNVKQVKRIQKMKLSNLIPLQRTESVIQLAQIYTAADIFVNPTYEDNFPTVNLEAEACGTPVITYDTGGCAETINDTKSIIIRQDISEVYEAICNYLE